jgi:ribosomal protein L37AE/L43A
MKLDCACPNCGQSTSVEGRKTAGWVACTKCGHVFKLAESLEPARPIAPVNQPMIVPSRRRRPAPACSPHLGVR